MPVEGVDDTVDFSSILRGVDGSGSLGVSETHQKWEHIVEK